MKFDPSEKRMLRMILNWNFRAIGIALDATRFVFCQGSNLRRSICRCMFRTPTLDYCHHQIHDQLSTICEKHSQNQGEMDNAFNLQYSIITHSANSSSL